MNLARVLDEFRQILLHLFERRHVDIHHVACVVVSHADVAAQRFVEAEMMEGLFGGEVGRAEIEVAVGDKDLEVFIEGH